jgi:hypothetical protein
MYSNLIKIYIILIKLNFLGSYHNAKTSIGAEYDKNTDSN